MNSAANSSAGGGPVEPPPWLMPLAGSLSEALSRLHGEPCEPRISELIAALLAALERGALDLPLRGPAPAEVSAEPWPAGHRQALAGSRLISDPQAPLVLEGDRLLWRRWHSQRQAVMAELVARATRRPVWEAPAGALPAEPEPGTEAVLAMDPLQQRARAAVLEHGLVLLEGGPGTGKTTTVAGMLAAVLAQAPQHRIHLAAPTGKAAARLRHATGGRWPCTTLHRLLESRGERFGRDRHHPLALDLLVVDEVSMVDLALMGALLEALPPACSLVLVGDPAQLPPIAPGPVLLELQRPALRQALGPAAVTLATTYRNAGAIAAVAATLRFGIVPTDTDTAATTAATTDTDARSSLGPPLRSALSQLPADANLRWRVASSRQLPAELLAPLQAHHRRLADLARRCTPGDGVAERALLRERDRLLVLAPRRTGRWGLEAIHRALLGDALAVGPSSWPAGTPVLCLRNLPELELANGDVGVLVGTGSAAPRLLFGAAERDDSLIAVHPAQLAGAVEPALALTVHKAQGSEAEEVIVLLPPALEGEARLLYTALTRARRRALLITAGTGSLAGEDRPDPANET